MSINNNINLNTDGYGFKIRLRSRRLKITQPMYPYGKHSDSKVDKIKDNDSCHHSTEYRIFREADHILPGPLKVRMFILFVVWVKKCIIL